MKKLHSLETEGCTALGPALAVAVGMTTNVPGAKILLCTDGMANQGVGKVDNSNKATALQFYRSLAEQARGNGVTVSVITMEGQDCRFGCALRIYRSLLPFVSLFIFPSIHSPVLDFVRSLYPFFHTRLFMFICCSV